jgi:hypothetical protein
VSLLKKAKPVTINRVAAYTRRAQGEIDRSYPGRSARVLVVLWCRRADGPHREVGLTGQKSAEVVVPAGDRMAAGKGRTSSEAEESVLLVLVALIAAIPRTRARCGGRR